MCVWCFYFPAYSYLWCSASRLLIFPFLPACFPCSFIHRPLVARSNCRCCSNKWGWLFANKLTISVGYSQIWESSFSACCFRFLCSCRSCSDPIFSASINRFTCVAQHPVVQDFNKSAAVCVSRGYAQCVWSCIGESVSILLGATTAAGRRKCILPNLFLFFFAPSFSLLIHNKLKFSNHRKNVGAKYANSLVIITCKLS